MIESSLVHSNLGQSGPGRIVKSEGNGPLFYCLPLHISDLSCRAQIGLLDSVCWVIVLFGGGEPFLDNCILFFGKPLRTLISFDKAQRVLTLVSIPLLS